MKLNTPAILAVRDYTRSAVLLRVPARARAFRREARSAAPQDLFSEHGVLRVNFTYQTTVDQNGNTLFCFMTESGAQSPTLHVHPGDRLLINLKNNVPAAHRIAMAAHGQPMPGMTVSGRPSSTCGAVTMTASSVNIHYHGTNTPPTCHQDEVIHTMINSGETFQYDVQFPLDEPPGLYWYHPHIHGISEAAVQGGASGALIVEGIQNINPEVAGLPQQVLIIRDNLVPGQSRRLEETSRRGISR